MLSEDGVPRNLTQVPPRDSIAESGVDSEDGDDVGTLPERMTGVSNALFDATLSPRAPEPKNMFGRQGNRVINPLPSDLPEASRQTTISKVNAKD